MPGPVKWLQESFGSVQGEMPFSGDSGVDGMRHRVWVQGAWMASGNHRLVMFPERYLKPAMEPILFRILLFLTTRCAGCLRLCSFWRHSALHWSVASEPTTRFMSGRERRLQRRTVVGLERAALMRAGF